MIEEQFFSPSESFPSGYEVPAQVNQLLSSVFDQHGFGWELGSIGELHFMYKSNWKKKNMNFEQHILYSVRKFKSQSGPV